MMCQTHKWHKYNMLRAYIGTAKYPMNGMKNIMMIGRHFDKSLRT